MKIQKLIILVGLPASGKTTFAENYVKENDDYARMHVDYYSREYQDTNIKIIDFDEMKDKVSSLKSNEISLSEIVEYSSKICLNKYTRVVILDGLFSTNEEYKLLIKAYKDAHKIERVEFHYWLPDVESCLWNDRGRRCKNSTDTIKNLKIEKPDVKALENIYGIPMSIVQHIVVRKPNYVVYADENDIRLYENRYICSSTWCLGGKGRGWDGSEYDISAEEPKEFDEFDDYLMKIAPNITFLQYKKLRGACVEMRERDNHDYYSSTKEAYWVCDVEKLHEMLSDWGYSVDIA